MGAAPPVGAAYRGLVLVVVPPCIRPRVTDFQPFEQLAFEVDTPREALLAAVVDDALRIVVGERRVVRGFLVGARERERVIRVDGRLSGIIGLSLTTQGQLSAWETSSAPATAFCAEPICQYPILTLDCRRYCLICRALTELLY